LTIGILSLKAPSGIDFQEPTLVSLIEEGVFSGWSKLKFYCMCWMILLIWTWREGCIRILLFFIMSLCSCCRFLRS